MLYYSITYIGLNIIKIKDMVVDIISIVIGGVIGLVIGLFLDVDMFSKKAEDVDAKVDDHSPENEGK